MKLQTLIVALFAAATLAAGCASTDARHGSNDPRYGAVRSNEGYYGVIVSIESGPDGSKGNAIAGAGGDAAAGAPGGHEIGNTNARPNTYSIRVRFDDRSYQTVTQASLDGLRVGDSVRIERDRVRRY